jgi:hypothetical protein
MFPYPTVVIDCAVKYTLDVQSQPSNCEYTKAPNPKKHTVEMIENDTSYKIEQFVSISLVFAEEANELIIRTCL